VVLIGGAVSSNVFWDVGSSATIGSATAFQGNIFTGTGSITLNTGASLSGRAITGVPGAVTMDTNAVSP
jgi:type VI secretion system secreted protein VgrG